MALPCSKNIICLLEGIALTHDSDVYCFNCPHLFITKTRLEFHETLCENKDFCDVLMHFENPEIIEFNQCRKFDKTLSIISESLIKRISKCKNVIHNKRR